tara:strand:+ start:270 stop:884 length:615 start_codon:yes stop_codon:yes gene_type:complete
MKKEFKKPNIRINKVYTKKGDSGETSLIGGQRLSKDDIRIETYGDIDELNSIIGGVRNTLPAHFSKNNKLIKIDVRLLQIQHELFNLGTMFATLDQKMLDNLPIVDVSNIKSLEDDIDRMTEILPDLESFILPGGSDSSIWLHKARTCCRRAERKAVALSKQSNVDTNAIIYLNRLSDALFVWSRYINVLLKVDETLWDPNKVS